MTLMANGDRASSIEQGFWRKIVYGNVVFHKKEFKHKQIIKLLYLLWLTYS